MANIYKKVNTDLITGTEQSVYTVASNTRSLVKSIHVYNEGAGDAVVTIKITSGSTYFYSKKIIAADATHEFIVNILILEEGDVLKMLSDITGPDVTISLLEISRSDQNG
tara:strand:- start:37 stop:366 length:330 start_codon:yes stop_codon:yes gene_type:complete